MRGNRKERTKEVELPELGDGLRGGEQERKELWMSVRILHIV